MDKFESAAVQSTQPKRDRTSEMAPVNQQVENTALATGRTSAKAAKQHAMQDGLVYAKTYSETTQQLSAKIGEHVEAARESMYNSIVRGGEQLQQDSEVNNDDFLSEFSSALKQLQA